MGKLLLVISLIANLSTCIAQTIPYWAWAKSFSGDLPQFSQTNFAYDMTIDLYDNIFLTGVFKDTVQFELQTLISAGETDIFIAKYSPEGTLLWVNRAGGTKKDEAHTICFNNAGNICIAGSFTDTAFFDSYTLKSSYLNMFIAQYNPLNGACTGVDSIGRGSIQSLKFDSLGNYYLSGYGNNVFDGQPVYDSYVVKFNSAFDFQWAALIPAFDFTIDSSLNVYAGGYFNGTLIFQGESYQANGSLFDYDGFLVKLEPTLGNGQWFKHVTGNSVQEIFFLTANNKEALYTTIYYRDTCEFDSIQIYGFPSGAILLARLDFDGNVEWVRNCYGDYNLQSLIIADNKEGDLAFGFSYFDNLLILGDDTIENEYGGIGATTSVISLSNKENYLEWVKQINGSVRFSTMEFDKSGNLIISGYTNGGIVAFGTDTIHYPFTPQKNFLAKLDIHPTGITTPNFTDCLPDDLPNLIRVENPWQFALHDQEFNVAIYNLLGQNIFSSANYQNDFVPMLAGVYLFEVQCQNGMKKKGKMVAAQ